MAFPEPAREIRVLVVDDSVFMRRCIQRLLEDRPGMRVVGAAADGVEGVQMALALRPDVVTMDVEMPRMDGVRAVMEIMRAIPTPVVMVSALTTRGAETTIRALEAGAVEVVAKPDGLLSELSALGEQLGSAVERASAARVTRVAGTQERTAGRRWAPGSGTADGLVVVGSSTGGPPALARVIGELPGDLGAGVLVVQHMPVGFTGALANRLNSLSDLEVREAAEGDALRAGSALVAPAGRHLMVTEEGTVTLEDSAPVHGVRPSVDVTLWSAVRVYGNRVVAAILTGMGCDGAAGCAQVEEAGGQVIVQDETTSVIYGMPGAALRCTKRAVEAPLEGIAAAIAAHVRPER